MATSVDSLPYDCLEHLCRYLSAECLLSLGATCSRLYSLINENSQVWKNTEQTQTAQKTVEYCREAAEDTREQFPRACLHKQVWYTQFKVKSQWKKVNAKYLTEIKDTENIYHLGTWKNGLLSLVTHPKLHIKICSFDDQNRINKMTQWEKVFVSFEHDSSTPGHNFHTQYVSHIQQDSECSNKILFQFFGYCVQPGNQRHTCIQLMVLDFSGDQPEVAFRRFFPAFDTEWCYDIVRLSWPYLLFLPSVRIWMEKKTRNIKIFDLRTGEVVRLIDNTENIVSKYVTINGVNKSVKVTLKPRLVDLNKWKEDIYVLRGYWNSDIVELIYCSSADAKDVKLIKIPDDVRLVGRNKSPNNIKSFFRENYILMTKRRSEDEVFELFLGKLVDDEMNSIKLKVEELNEVETWNMSSLVLALCMRRTRQIHLCDTRTGAVLTTIDWGAEINTQSPRSIAQVEIKGTNMLIGWVKKRSPRYSYISCGKSEESMDTSNTE